MADFTFQVSAETDISDIRRFFDEIEQGSKKAVDQLNNVLRKTPDETTKTIVFESVFNDKGGRKAIATERESLGLAGNILAKKKAIEALEESSLTRIRQQLNSAKQARDAVAKYQTELDATGKRVTQINQRWAELNLEVQKYGRTLSQIDGSGFWKRLKEGTAVGGLLDAFNGITQLANGFQSLSIIVGQITASINTLTDALAGLQSFGLAFEAIGQGAAGARQALSESSRIALNLGVSLQGVRTSFQQLSPVILNTGGSISDVSKITEALSSRFAAFGISGDRARRVTNAIIQAFGKGKLQAEEFTQQIGEADPAFGTDFAKALGISTAKLLELIKAGSITNDVLIETIPKLTKSSLVYGKLGTSAVDAANSLTRSGNEIGPTIDQVRTKIASLNQLSLERLAKTAEPFLFAIIKVQAVVSDFFSTLSKSATVEALGRVLGGVAGSIALLIQSLTTIISPLLSVVDAVSSLLNVFLQFQPVAIGVGLILGGKLIQSLGLVKQGFDRAAASGGAFGQLITKLSGPYRDLMQTGFGVGSASQQLGQVVDGTSKSFQKQLNTIGKLQLASAASASSISKLKTELESLGTELQSIQSSKKPLVDVSTGKQTQLGARAATLEKEIAKKEKMLTGASRSQQKIPQMQQAAAATLATAGPKGTDSKAIQEYATASTTAAEQVGKFAQANALLTQDIEKSKGAISGATNSQGILSKALANGTITQEKYDKASKVLQDTIAQKNAKISLNSSIITSNNGKTKALAGSLQGLSGAAQGTQGRFSSLTSGLRSTGKAFVSIAIGGVQGLRAALTSLYAALGPIGTAIAALAAVIGVVQAAYSNANAKSQEEIEKTKASVEAYDSIINRLGTEEIKPPNLSATEKLWLSFSLYVADAVDNALIYWNKFTGMIIDGVNKMISIIPGLREVLRLLPPVLSGPVLAALQVYEDAMDDAGLSTRKLVRDTKEGIKGLSTEVGKIDEATKALRAFAASDKGQTTEGKLTAVGEYKNLEEQVGTTEDRLKGFEDQYARAQEQLRANPGSKKAQDDFNKTKQELDKVRQALIQKRAELIRLGIELNATGVPIAGLENSLGALNEKLKASKDAFENAVPGTDPFKAQIASILATENAIEDLQEQAKDPIVIKAGIEIRRKELENDLNKTQAKISEIEKIPLKQRSLTQTDSLQDAWKEADRLNSELSKLNKLDIKISAKSIDNLNAKLKTIESKITEVDISSPELPKLIRNLVLTQNNLDKLNTRKNRIEIEIIQKGIQLNLLNTSFENVNKQVKLLEANIQTLDVRSPEFKRTIGELQIAKERLEDLNFQKAQIEIEFIERGIEEGSIIETTSKLKEKLDLINGQIARVGIESPELPQLVSNLIATEERINNLNGRVAALTVRIIEERVQKGEPLTQGLADARIAAQQAVIRATPTTASNYSQELEKLKTFERQREVLALTNEELQQKIAQNIRETQSENNRANLDELKAQTDAITDKYDTELRQLKEQSELADEASEKKKRSIQEEMSKTDEMYENQKQQMQEIASMNQAQHEKQLRNLDEQWARRKKYLDEERKKIEGGGVAGQIKQQQKDAEEEIRLRQVSVGVAPIEYSKSGKIKFGKKPTLEEQQKAKDELEQLDIKKQLAQFDKQVQKEEQTYLQNRKALEDKGAKDKEAQQKKEIDLEKENQAKKKAADKEIADIEEKDRQRKEEEKKKEQELEKKASEEKKKLKEEERKQEEADREARKKEREEQQKERDKQLAALQEELKVRQEARNSTQQRRDLTEEETKAVTERLAPAIKGTSETVDKVLKPAMEATAASAQNILKPSLEASANAAKVIANEIKSLDGKTITVYVKQVALAPGRWAGGPVEGGQQYQVNELGKEGFLSSTGRLTPINKPRNGLWTAPTSGTVIPANIWDKLDVPSSGVQVTNKPTASIRSKDSDLAKIANQIQASLAAQSNDELAMVQAQQAVEIGKLSRAVDRLADKKWNVQVGVTSTSNSAYLRTLNNMM